LPFAKPASRKSSKARSSHQSQKPAAGKAFSQENIPNKKARRSTMIPMGALETRADKARSVTDNANHDPVESNGAPDLDRITPSALELLGQVQVIDNSPRYASVAIQTVPFVSRSDEKHGGLELSSSSTPALPPEASNSQVSDEWRRAVESFVREHQERVMPMMDVREDAIEAAIKELLGNESFIRLCENVEMVWQRTVVGT